MLSKKEIGMIALAGVGLVGITYFIGGDAVGGGGKRAGQILGSPGAMPLGGLPSTGVSSPKLAGAISTSVTQPYITEDKKKMVKSGFSAQKAGYVMAAGGGPRAYTAPESFIAQKGTKYEVIATPVTVGRPTKLTAKGMAVKKRVAERKEKGG